MDEQRADPVDRARPPAEAEPPDLDGDRARGRSSPAHVTPGRTILGRQFTQFRWLWGTFAIASAGDGLIYGAVPLLAVVVDPSPVAVSAVAAANTFPWLLLSFHAGMLADRYQRGRVMAWSNLLRAVVLAAMASLVVLHRMNIGLLIVFVLLNASVRAIYYSASQAAIPEMVPTRDLNRANGVMFGTEAATENLGGPIAGTAIFAIARSIPFVADALAMVGSGLGLFRLQTKRPEEAKRRTTMSDGFRTLIRDPALRTLVSLIASLAGLQGLVDGVLVLVATRDWGVHASFYGTFLAAQGVGNILGGLLSARVAKRLGTVPTLIGSATLSGLGYLGMALSHSWLPAGVAIVAVGFAVGCGGVVAISARQRMTSDELMGRVTAAWRGLVWGAAPTGALAAGGLALLGGLRLPLYVAGGAQCAVALALVRPIAHRFRDADVPDSVSAPGL